jgi:acetoin utilization deacetylase AcuC-like enzyme
VTTGIVWEDRYLLHDAGPAALFIPAGGLVEPGPHIETPGRVARIEWLLRASGALYSLVRVPARMATDEELLRFHTAAYLERVRELSDGDGGDAGDFAPVGRGSDEIARLAAGGCLAAVDAVVGGTVDNAYALVRPCGHHALPDRGLGGAIFANGVLCVLHARAVHGLRRVAVVDWDVHHGNSAQFAFVGDDDALTISLHQDGYFPPGSGSVDESTATNVNVPLPPGSGEGAYLAALERVVAPALRGFEPELVILATGYDASACDPMGRMLLTSDTFRRLTELVLETCPRAVAIHEGGYNLGYVPFCAVAVIEALAGERFAPDPFLPTFASMPGQELQPWQEEAIERAGQRLR